MIPQNALLNPGKGQTSRLPMRRGPRVDSYLTRYAFGGFASDHVGNILSPILSIVAFAFFRTDYFPTFSCSFGSGFAHVAASVALRRRLSAFGGNALPLIDARRVIRAASGRRRSPPDAAGKRGGALFEKYCVDGAYCTSRRRTPSRKAFWRRRSLAAPRSLEGGSRTGGSALRWLRNAAPMFVRILCNIPYLT